MSSFSTNRATRRGKRAKTSGNRYANILATTGPAASKDMEHNTGRSQLSRPPQLQHTVIGGHSSKGLTIQGGMAAFDWTVGDNPDGRDIPLGTSGQAGTGGGDGYGRFPDTQLADPVYPIRFTGPGHLKFEQPLEIPVIQGDVEITGALSWRNGVNIPTTLEVVNTTSGDLTGGTTTGVHVAIGTMRFISLNFSWTGKDPLFSGNNPVQMTGLPVPNASHTVGLRVYNTDGVAGTTIGAEISVIYKSGAYGFYEEDPHSALPPLALTDAAFDATGFFTISGWIVV